MRWVTVSVAALIALMGIRALVKALREEFVPASMGEVLAFSLYRMAGVGLWFGVAGLLAGKALLDHPSRFNWFVLVPISLAGVQLLSGLFLSRSPAAAPEARGSRQGGEASPSSGAPPSGNS